MATPVDVTYSVASGLPIYGGRFSASPNITPGVGALSITGYAPSVAIHVAWWSGATMALLVAGDSIASGWTAYNSPWESPPDGTGDVTTTAEYQCARSYDAGATPAFTFADRGIGGTNFALWAAYPTDWCAGSPLATIIHLGVNDIAEGYASVDMLGYLSTIRTNLLSISPSTHLFVDEIIPTSYLDGKQTQRNDWNTTQLPTWCTANGATVIPLQAAMQDPGNHDHMNSIYYGSGGTDPVHPNALGYGVMGAQWKIALDAYFG